MKHAILYRILALRRRRELLVRALALERIRESIRTRNKINSSALNHSADQNWRVIWESGDDSSLIAVTGLARQGIINLHVEWVKRIGRLSPRGRPRRLEPLAWLLLILMFYVGTMEYKTLCQIFGIPSATLGRYIIAGEMHLAAV